MRNLANMIQAASQTPAEPSEPTTTQFTVWTDNPSLEAYAGRLAERLPTATFEHPESFSVALESMQQQAVDNARDTAARYQDLLEAVNPKSSTGSVQVFLLDETGLASGHAGSNAALKALVRTSIKDASKVVAALTSGWSTLADAPECTVEETKVVIAQRGVLKNYLLASGVMAFENFDELVEHLAAC